MDIQSFEPRNRILRKHIYFYYFLKTDDSAFDVKYFAFPNISTPLSFHKNVRTEITDYSTSVSGDSTLNYAALVQGMRNRPLLINLKGTIDKITIAFKPLGINRFIKKSFAEICPKDSQLFEEWNVNPGFDDFLRNFYATEERDARVELLETFLLSIYETREHLAVIERSIGLLTDFDDEKTIADISRRLGLHIRTFNRMFKSSAGIGPIGFKQIARFRHSLDFKVFSEQFRRLVDLAYESNYYDQAYFIKIYRKMTGSNPTVFFETIEKLAGDKVLFKFIK